MTPGEPSEAAASVARRMRRLIVALAALTLLVAPPAEAWTVHDVIRDCSLNGKLTHDYPPSLIRKARNSLPADVDEYTDCRDLLSAPSGGQGGASNAAGAGATGARGSGGGGSAPSGSANTSTPAATPSAEELKALDAARAGSSAQPVDVGGGKPIVPGAAGMTTGAVDNGLPSTLLVVLILFALAVAAAGGPLLRQRWASGRSPRSALRRVLDRRPS